MSSFLLKKRLHPDSGTVDIDKLTDVSLTGAVYSNSSGSDFSGFADAGNITLSSAGQKILFNLPGASNGKGNFFIKDEEYAVYVKGNYTGTKGFSVVATSGFTAKSESDNLTFPAEHEKGAFEYIFTGKATDSCGGLAIMPASGQDGVEGLSISEIKAGPLHPGNEGVEDENGIVMTVPRNYKAKTQGVDYGTFQGDEYYSGYTKSNRPFNVILPPGYTTEKKYPVIYMLHGIGCNQDSFGASADNCPIVQIAGNLYAEKQAREAIIVIPNIRVSAEPEPDPIFNAENYKCYDLFREDLIEYLMPYMEQNYSIATGRENTAIAGFSMGGREALYIGTTKSEYFGYVAGFCPTYGLFSYPPNWTGVGEDGLFKDKKDFTLPAEHMDKTLLMVVKGSADGTVGNMPKEYHEVLETNGVPHYYYVVEGGEHNDVTWSHGLYNYMRKIFS